MYWLNVSSNHPCIICGKTDWCAYSADGRYSLCRREFSPIGELKIDKAGHEYCQYDHRPGESPSHVYPIEFPISKTSEKPITPRAEPDLLDRIYRALLQELTLIDAHRENLRARGLSDDEIFRRGYKSWPGTGRAEICKKLLEIFDNKTLLRVPGFYWKSDSKNTSRRWLSLTGYTGLVIPVRDVQRRIIALRLRIDDTEAAAKGGKYKWITSTYHGGPGPGAPIHIPGIDADPHGILIRVTEGELKADIATALSGVLTLSVPGVGNWQPLIPILKELQTMIVRIAYDADAPKNRRVASALHDLAQALVHNGIMVELETWPAESGKGIDDVLAAGGTAEVLSGNEAMDKIISIYEDAKRADPPPHERALADARERIGDLDERLNDPGFLDDQENLKALATIRRNAAGQWLLEFKKILLQRGIFREVNGMVDAVERNIATPNGKAGNKKGGGTSGGVINIELDEGKKLEYGPGFGKSLTDLGNAERLVLAYRNDIRYCKEWGKWLIWDGNRWVIDKINQITTMAMEIIRNIYREAAECPDPDRREKLIKHATYSERERSVLAIPKLAESIAGIPITQDQLDADPYLLGIKNGIVDLRTGELLKPQREQFITKQAQVNYDLDAQYPLFENFITKIMMGNENLIQFIQLAVGYSLTGITSERCMFILHGTGKNGKSTLLEILYTMLGDYAVRTPTETLMTKYYGSGIPNDIARLKGARFVSASESEEGQRLAESRIKDLTGKDAISARFMRGEYFDFIPEFKIWLATNHKPQIRGTDRAIWDRIKLLPFEYRISDEECDLHLLEKLKRETDGIFQWALAGCLAWGKNCLITINEVETAITNYRLEEDIIGQFIDDCCVLDGVSVTPVKDLYEEYDKWCQINKEKPVSKKRFSQRLYDRGLQQTRDTKTRYIKGIYVKFE